MYQEFSVMAIEPILNKKQIVITVSKDINTNLFKDTVIEVYERATKTSVLFDTEITGKVLTLTFKEWPIPNSEYILIVNGLKSATEETLSSNIKKRVKFESNIISTVNIINPTMFEQIESLTVELKEIAEKEEDLKNSFYIEISSDNAFINIAVKTLIKKNLVKLTLPKHDQYYMRVRVQEDAELNQYGLWSDVITFTYGDKSISGEMPDITDPDEDKDPMEPDVDLEDFELISELEQGYTPKSLVLEFSKEVDELSLSNIIIIRKVVK